MRIVLLVNETEIAELSEEDVENIILEYIEKNHPESQPLDDDYLQIIPMDY